MRLRRTFLIHRPIARPVRLRSGQAERPIHLTILAGRHCRSYILAARDAQDNGGNLWQRQLLLQKRNVLRQPKKIFCRWRVPITSNFTLATPSRRPTFTRAPSVSKVWLTADPKRASKIAPVTPFDR